MKTFLIKTTLNKNAETEHQTLDTIEKINKQSLGKQIGSKALKYYIILKNGNKKVFNFSEFLSLNNYVFSIIKA
jgi:arginyl-tRNA synthetase